jgi:hypothetical protein
MDEAKVKEMTENVHKLIELHDRLNENHKKLFVLCLRELRKSKLFIQMSREERANRRDLIDTLEKLTGEGK